MLTFIFYYLPMLIVAYAVTKELIEEHKAGGHIELSAVGFVLAGIFIPLFNLYLAVNLLKEYYEDYTSRNSKN